MEIFDKNVMERISNYIERFKNKNQWNASSDVADDIFN